MAVAVIGSALRARHPRDVYLDPREFSGVVVVLGIWNPTESADNASAAHWPKVRDGLGRCDSRTRGAPGGSGRCNRRSVPVAFVLRACRRSRVAVFTLRGQTFCETVCAVDDVAFRVGRAEISNWAVRCGRRSPSRRAVLVPVCSKPADAVADVGDAVPVSHDRPPNGPASRAAARQPAVLSGQKRRGEPDGRQPGHARRGDSGGHRRGAGQKPPPRAGRGTTRSGECRPAGRAG